MEKNNKEYCECNNSKRSKFALGIIEVILILGLVLIVAYAGIQMYTIYTNSNLQKQAVQYAVDTEAMLEIQFTDNSAIAFNVNPGTNPSVLNSSSGSTRTVKVVPRYYITEYYRTPNGNIITPYSNGTANY
jgi:type II secretory pathway pseudopilin PulG